MLLSELVRKRRKELELSQVEVAVKADLYQRTISDIERGVAKRPALRTLQSLAKALDLPLSELVAASGHAESLEDAKRLETAMEDAEHDPYLTQLLWEVKELDEGGRRMVLDQARLVRRWQRTVEKSVEDAGGDEGE